MYYLKELFAKFAKSYYSVLIIINNSFISEIYITKKKYKISNDTSIYT